jgi:cysteine desulfurase
MFSARPLKFPCSGVSGSETSSGMIYLDHNATTPLDPRVLEAMLPYLGPFYGNPSALHRLGRLSRSAIERAREQVAVLAGARADQIIFTSGGTESSNLAIYGFAAQFDGALLLSGRTEHPSVAEPLSALAHARGWPQCFLPMDAGGVHGVPVSDAIPEGPVLAALMLANNETGVIENPTPLATFIRGRGGVLHVDAVQAAGKIPLDFPAMGAHSMALSAHKIRGPKGVGALVLDPSATISPRAHGGGQERGLRPGTENVAGIVGFGMAAELAHQELEARMSHLRELRDWLEAGLSLMEGVQIHAKESPRLSNTLQFSMTGWEGETLVMALDLKGFMVSSGSACASGGNEPSPILLAMGVPVDVARGAIRVSLGLENDISQIDAFLEALRGLHAAPDGARRPL